MNEMDSISSFEEVLHLREKIYKTQVSKKHSSMVKVHFPISAIEHQIDWQRNKENHQKYAGSRIKITKLNGIKWQEIGQGC